MKKSLLLALAIATMASCSQNEVITNGSTASNPISFAPQFGNSVATRIDAGLDQSIPLGVYAYNSNSIYDEIENLPLAYNADGWYLTPKEHYYPNDDSEVNFWAYGPKEQTQLGSSQACDATNGPSFTLTLVNTDKDVDILATQAVVTGKKSTSSTPIAFTLKHVLAQVKFKAKVNNKDNVDAFDVKIYQITIATKGTANYANKTWSSFSSDLTWTVVNAEEPALTENATDVKTPVNLIPEQETTITVKAKVYKKGSDIVISDQTATLTTNGTSTPHLEQGNCYTYTITVTPNVGQITFAEPKVTGWVDQPGELAPVVPAP